MPRQAQASQRTAGAIPAYQRIKNYVLQQIRSGIWTEGAVIPTELALCKQFSVSRMTVHRALRELTADQVLLRYQGSGTYVAPAKIPATLIEIRSIAQDIRDRGHQHSCKVLQLQQLQASSAQAKRFRLRAGAPLFHSLIIHYENEIPIQLEDRLVDARRVPEYLQQDWSQMTPNEYLMRVAPDPTGLYTIEVKLPSADTAEPLDIPLDQPCLVLDRVTFSSDAFTSQAVMWYPGNRYKLAGKI
ncbi:histidine utilization repressor [Castellaniella sp.]|uniref:histidine utilization repressor n=1 Tax=Castellaniella sp. TaxID=1955812 RepID=UPI002B0018E2|nr:histidine utilization repressor [Castellaniella sp.]